MKAQLLFLNLSEMKQKKIYFAGSIRGGRQDAELYKRIIQHMQREHIVLTEHVGDLSLSKNEGVKDRDVAIYEQDISACSFPEAIIPCTAGTPITFGKSLDSII